MALTLESLRGKVLDTDSHESIPAPGWSRAFGERGARFVESARELIQLTEAMSPGENAHILRDYDDDSPITSRTVWEEKGFEAPSAVDIGRRQAVLDEMGISRALVFPGMGILAWVEAHGGGFSGMPLAGPDQQKTGHEALEAFTEWAIAHNSDRTRIARLLSAGQPGMTPELMTKKAEAMIKAGLKVVHIGTGHPPG